ncbi:hypothetical protein NEOLEDRAFT_1122948 [Neolentinus lepideus HHB14362 ss-1]|uniref:Uncharacterized protein n=1 Tax=Neolentinus lepideus HHB14362 ss-1 TaxID=1314782 RepID=A0A165NXP4_9AGAM|nr:hypothetical protein NEOLEDRAFT_1122948 [Neolentinus lepideus HHB14362 ss-1]
MRGRGRCRGRKCARWRWRRGECFGCLCACDDSGLMNECLVDVKEACTNGERHSGDLGFFELFAVESGTFVTVIIAVIISCTLSSPASLIGIVLL